ncbi:MAG: DNA polymerase III subunit gamma/tau [Armatimonadota bacterium]
MAYQSLYRKYRSRDFTDLMGQRHVTQTLANAIGSGRVSHAYLFCGPRGTGKTSTARVLAKALNCINGPTATPCDECPYCISIRQGNAIDVIEIDAASNRNIDDMRQLREQVNYPPVELRYKFYIVDEVHQLTRDAFNAFLKTLEEPPGHVIFVLCTTDQHQLPATILSRCQRFDFHRITQDDITERLHWVVGQEGWTVEDEAVHLLARAANGGLRDALSLLDQAASYAGTDITAQHIRDILGGIDLDLLTQFTDTVLKKDAVGLFRLVDTIISDGKDVPQLVGELIQHWRHLLRALIGGPDALVEFTPEQRNLLAGQARQTNQPSLMRAITLLCEAENELRWNAQQRLLLELYSLRIMGEEPTSAPAAIAAPAAVAATPSQPVARRFDTPRPAEPAPRPAAPAPATATPRPTEPAPKPAAPAPEQAAASPVGEWTLPRLKKAWPQFIEWLGRSPKLENLRTRIVEKCWPQSLIGDRLTLNTASAFTRSQVIERPQVQQVLQQCLQSYFKAPFIVSVEVQNGGDKTPEPAPAPTPAASAAPEPTAPVAAAPIPEPTPAPAAEEPTARDIVGERMKQVFSGSEEVTQ